MRWLSLTSHPLHTTNVLEWGSLNESYCCSEVHSCLSRLWLRPCLSAFFYLDLGLPCSCRLDEPAVVAISLGQKNFIVPVPEKGAGFWLPWYTTRKLLGGLIVPEASQKCWSNYKSLRTGSSLLRMWLTVEESRWISSPILFVLFKM